MNHSLLSDGDYPADDLSSVRDAMNLTIAHLTAQMKEHTSDGVWQPQSDSPLGQIVEADQFLKNISLAVTQARSVLRAADSRARERLLSRTVHDTPST